MAQCKPGIKLHFLEQWKIHSVIYFTFVGVLRRSRFPPQIFENFKQKHSSCYPKQIVRLSRNCAACCKPLTPTHSCTNQVHAFLKFVVIFTLLWKSGLFVFTICSQCPKQEVRAIVMPEQPILRVQGLSRPQYKWIKRSTCNKAQRKISLLLGLRVLKQVNIRNVQPRAEEHMTGSNSCILLSGRTKTPIKKRALSPRPVQR